MNAINLIGRVCRDEELKESRSGKSYIRTSIAVNRAYDKDKADFFNIVAFGKTAEVIGQYATKGKQIGVQGRMESNKSDDGKIFWDVVVERVILLDSKKEKHDTGNSPAPQGGGYDDDDDSFPF